MQKFICLLSLLATLAMAGCSSAPVVSTRDDVALQIGALEESILALGPEVDAGEAARAARIAFLHTKQLAGEYQITDPPLIHNMKVNAGLRPRGLCWHWAEDMEARLLEEDFQTLDLHRAIANAGHPYRIEHSTAIVSRRGDRMADGVVLDPWRYGGILFWSPVKEDKRYEWVPREEVLAEKRRRQQFQQRLARAG